MPPIAHARRLLKRELAARGLSANRLPLDLDVPSGRITDILSGRRGITADTAVRLGRDSGYRAQFSLDLKSQCGISVEERGLERGVLRPSRFFFAPSSAGFRWRGCGGVFSMRLITASRRRATSPSSYRSSD